MEEAHQLLGTGKRHLVMGKVVEAVSALQESCAMLASKYGDTAEECGEAFFWCGKALLDLARMENSVLVNALEGVPEEDEEEDEEDKSKDSNVECTENLDEKTRDELRVQVYDAMAEKTVEDAAKTVEDEEKTVEDEEKTVEDEEKTVKDEEKTVEDEEKTVEDEEKTVEDEEKVEGKQSEDAEKSETAVEEQKTVKVEAEEEMNDQDDGSKPEEEKDDEETDKETSENETESAEKEEEAADVEMAGDAETQGDQTAEKDSEEEEEEEEEEEDVGNLQLAWEMLEVAKVIYKRKDTKEDQLMAAQAHLKLGEVSAESGNYTQALEDFKECLKLQMNHLESDSRLLAETNYHLGLTYSLNFQYAQAIEALDRSIAVIKSRLDKLQEMLGKAEGPEALPDERQEMEELNALLPEIQDKVEDATEGLKITNTAVDAVKEALDNAASSSAFFGSTSRDDSSSIAANKDSSGSSTSSTSEETSAAPVSDISHLVRKKRKPEDSPVEEESVVKKVKQDEGQPDAVKEP
ncbi:histone-binding protein N1/N2-like isoform X2 [Embiotoca jacksoni]|uniref:histone-binding protein N1/N2-like isoform X2 n=1 Tax=Embiotoca jacksoni TaxID=100190 RepID=UPI003703B9BE